MVIPLSKVHDDPLQPTAFPPRISFGPDRSCRVDAADSDLSSARRKGSKFLFTHHPGGRRIGAIQLQRGPQEES